MNDKELRKLSRKELLEMLIEQTKENARLEAELAEVKEGLEEKKITIDRAGTLAEAALALNRVFEAADAAAKQYLENVRKANGEPDGEPEADEESPEIKAERILGDAEKKAQEILTGADKKAEEITSEAEKKAEETVTEAGKKAEETISEAQKKAEETVAAADNYRGMRIKEVNSYVNQINKRIDEYYASHPDIAENCSIPGDSEKSGNNEE